jgi:ferredoxin--NADP+ reductase
MRHFAIVGSGPAGFYTAEALDKAYGGAARIDIRDR